VSTELLVALAKGMATYIPGLRRLSGRHTGGSVSARYCYSVWLRHLSIAHAHGLTALPESVAELGPGDSLGTGLAALLSGANRLYALDVVRYAETERNLAVLDQLVDLFSRRAPIPGDDELPDVKPRLDSYAFPHAVLDEGRLGRALEPDRIAAIRAAVRSSGDAAPRSDGAAAGIRIQYSAPWSDPSVIEPESVGLVYSQAVLQHVVDLDATYDALHRWLAPRGWMSHQIDFRSHGLAREWNGHWGYSDATWKWIQGRKPYLLNRAPHSAHLALLSRHGFDVVVDQTLRRDPGIGRGRLAPRFASIDDDDLHTSGALIQSRRR
jgi:hypothetical protein